MSNVTVGDMSMHVVQRGAGRPLLLVHGFPLDHQMWQGQIDELAAEYHVVAPDLRGFGRSDVTSGTVTMERFADDLAQLLDRLELHQPIALAGLSMGGYIAWQFWRRHEERLSHLILCDTRAVADSSDEAAARLHTADLVSDEGPLPLIKTMIPKLFSEESLANRTELVSATEQVIRSARPEGLAAALRGMAQRPDVTGWLHQIKIPTLVVCGQDDSISRVEEMGAIAEGISNSRFAVIAKCGHLSPLEDPVAVNRELSAFLS